MKLWFIIEDYGIRHYSGNEPAFYDINNFCWTKKIKENWKTILKEFQPLIDALEENELKPYYNAEIQFPPKKWKTLGLMFWGKRNKANWSKYPLTTQIMSSIPGLVGISLSKLEAGASIKPHSGETNGIIRCHLGLDIPASLPECGFQVKDEQRSWQNGEIIMFTDAHIHKAWNNSDKQRYILLFDIIKPEFLGQKNIICRNVLALLSMDFVARKLKLNFIYNSSKSFQLFAYSLFKFAWSVYYPLHRYLNIIK